MNNLAIFTLIITGLFFIGFYLKLFFGLVRPEKRRHLTYSVYKARDRLIKSIYQDKVDRNDPAFLLVYELINNYLSVYKKISFRKFVYSSILIKKNEELLREVDRKWNIIKEADKNIKEPFDDLIKALMNMLYEASLFLRLIIKLRFLLKKISIVFKPPIKTPNIYRSYNRLEYYDSILYTV